MPRQTKSAVLFEIGKPLHFISLTMPELEQGQVSVRLAYTSVCHTQLSEARGRRGPDRFLPHTLGHEAAGVVMQTGPDVKKVKAGDPVVLAWIKGSGLEVPSVSLNSPKAGSIQGPSEPLCAKPSPVKTALCPLPRTCPCVRLRFWAVRSRRAVESCATRPKKQKGKHGRGVHGASVYRTACESLLEWTVWVPCR